MMIVMFREPHLEIAFDLDRKRSTVDAAGLTAVAETFTTMGVVVGRSAGTQRRPWPRGPLRDAAAATGVPSGAAIGQNRTMVTSVCPPVSGRPLCDRLAAIGALREP